MSNFSRKKRLVVASALLAVGAALLPALPAAAATSSIACGGYVETILNGNTGGGNSIARTYNTNGACGSVGHAATVNQGGQILFIPRNSWSTTKGTITRTFYGSMQSSVHYHNGTSNTL